MTMNTQTTLQSYALWPAVSYPKPKPRGFSTFSTFSNCTRTVRKIEIVENAEKVVPLSPDRSTTTTYGNSHYSTSCVDDIEQFLLIDDEFHPDGLAVVEELNLQRQTADGWLIMLEKKQLVAIVSPVALFLKPQLARDGDVALIVHDIVAQGATLDPLKLQQVNPLLDPAGQLVEVSPGGLTQAVTILNDFFHLANDSLSGLTAPLLRHALAHLKKSDEHVGWLIV